MSVSLGDMHAHLVRVVATAHLAKAAQEAAERALSDVAAETHYQDWDTHTEQLVALICTDGGSRIIAALADELQAMILDLGADDPAVQVSA